MLLSEMTFINKGPKISERTIIEFERQWDIELPGDYKEFLLAYNGGQSLIYTCDKPFFEFGNWLSLIPRGAALADNVRSLVEVNRDLKVELYDVKDEYLILALARELNSFLLMKIRGSSRHRIGIFSMSQNDLIEDQKLPCSSFSDFVSRLHESKEQW